MKRGMTIEYLKCRKDLNFEVDFGVNGAIDAIVTKWDLILFGKWIVFNHNKYFLNKLHVPFSKKYIAYFSNSFCIKCLIHFLCTY